MTIVGGLDIHRKQLTFDYPGTGQAPVPQTFSLNGVDRSAPRPARPRFPRLRRRRRGLAGTTQGRGCGRIATTAGDLNRFPGPAWIDGAARRVRDG
jgi:hypothetical protein